MVPAQPGAGQPGGKSTIIAPKSDWKTFFANALKLGSKETPTTKSQSELAEVMYRGAYRAGENQKGLILVSDLRFMLGGRMVSDKFARLLVENPDLLSRLAQLAPGDFIDPKLMALLGSRQVASRQMASDLNYLQLTHMTSVLTGEAREAAREAAMQQLKNPSNPQAQGRLERALLQERSRLDVEEEERQKRRRGEKGEEGEGRWAWPGGDPRFEREKRLGRPRFWIFFAGSVGILFALIPLRYHKI